MATILMVDDDLEVLELNKRFLTKEGFTVYTSDSSEKSLDLASQISPGLHSSGCNDARYGRVPALQKDPGIFLLSHYFSYGKKQ